MAAGAVVNAALDLRCRREGKPLWKLLADLSPEEVVDLVGGDDLTNVLDRHRALELLRAAQEGKADRERVLREQGFPACTTTPGWLGDSDEELTRLFREALGEGFDHIKLKVGAGLADDMPRCRLAREVVRPDVILSVDANQRWEVGQATDWVRELAPCGIHWIEEPATPDDVLAEHFAVPTEPGTGACTLPQSLADHAFPAGLVWQEAA